ncbi:MAG: lysylphosphatidylglycerol synthase transmembrane domain-containing protein [Myxococcota bacterium]
MNPSSPSSPREGESSRRTFQTKLIHGVIFSSLLGGLVFAGLALYGDIQLMRQHMLQFEAPAFLCALGLSSLNYGVRFLRWELYLRHITVFISIRSSVLIFLSGFLMSVTPGKLGELLKSALLLQVHQVPVERTAPVVLAERVTDLIALLLLAAVGGFAFQWGLSILIGGLILAVALILLCTFPALGDRLLSILSRIEKVRAVVPRLRHAYETLHRLTAPRALIPATALSTLAWVLECVALHQIARGFTELQIDLPAAIFAYAIPTIAGAVALMPGGLGVTEATMTGALFFVADNAIDPAIAVSVTLMVRLTTLWWAVLLGSIALPLLRFSSPR